MSKPAGETLNAGALPRGADERGWEVLRAAARHARSTSAMSTGTFGLAASGNLEAVASGDAKAMLERRPDGTWTSTRSVPREWLALFDLYLPICGAGPSCPVTIGHLGQSLDGYIATRAGDSSYVNGPENILHLHRMRALCDAVVVGAATIENDDPRLTVRLASGDNPLRVVLDPRLRLASRHRVFADAEARTLVICAAEHAHARRVGLAEVVGVPSRDSALDLAALVALLHVRGCHAIFVEGGGETVSRFLEARLLDRLQIAVAPLIMGSGLPGVRLPGVERIAECARHAHRLYTMGGDVLFDCDVRTPAGARDPSSAPIERIY